MSLALDSARAGTVACVCPPEIAGATQPPRVVALFGVGAAASVLSQALMVALLPRVGAMLAPDPALPALPFVALFVGAIAATVPAAFLTDAFGRRAAFALGASFGIAGGLVVAWALVHAAFWPLAVGALWLGIANGFALRYRHAAAGQSTHAVAIVIGAGAVIGVAAPTLAGLFELQLLPVVGAGGALLAALAHVCALAAALLLPARPEPPGEAAAHGRRGWLAPTAIAALAWFAMMAVMAYAPLGLAGCGIGYSATVGAIAWHLVAMYAPALALAVLIAALGSLRVAALGLVVLAAAIALVWLADGAGLLVAALVAAGVGWSLATSAALIALHRAAPSRLAVAAHDATILIAGVAGSMVAFAAAS